MTTASASASPTSASPTSVTSSAVAPARPTNTSATNWRRNENSRRASAADNAGRASVCRAEWQPRVDRQQPGLWRARKTLNAAGHCVRPIEFRHGGFIGRGGHVRQD